MLELNWARAWGAWALLLPVVLLLLARARTRPPARATGTFALWRRIAAATPTESRSRRPRIPPAVWLLALALLLGATALAGPRLVLPRGPRDFSVVVDHSPATALAWLEDDGAAGPGAETRLERALARAVDRLADEVAPGDRVRWISTARRPHESLGAEPPPVAWRVHPPWPAPAPDWAVHDRPGVLWVTDRPPAVAPVRAGLFASGGAAVHGPVASDGVDRIDWDGTDLVRVEGGAGRRLVHVAEQASLPPPIARMVDAWASARGYGRNDFARDFEGAETALEIHAARARDGTTSVECGRDGWRAVVAVGVSAEGDERPWETWLEVGGVPLVRCAPGVIRLGFTEMDEPLGDPAAFAVSWSELFDRCVLPPRGVVALEHRVAAGGAFERAPDPPPAGAVPAADEEAWAWAAPLDAWLAGAAALLALASLSAGLFRRV